MEFKRDISNLSLVPSTGGVFELEVDGDLVYSKKETGKFPDETWAVNAVRKRMKRK
jgi:selenoprotein W-related protein